MENKRNARRGFTLIELLVVVLIIAVLAMVAMPQYKHAVLKSRFSTVMPMAKAVADANEVYFLGNNQYALGTDELDVESVQAENTSVTLSQTDGYDYVMGQRSDVPGVHYIQYQKHSENYPSEIHCEAEDENADAQWLCGALSNNNSIGKTITDGYTTYLISGTGAVIVPGGNGGDEPGGNSEPATAMCSGEQPADITASNSGATGTASCVNGQWVYAWTGGNVYDTDYNGSVVTVCTGNSEYGCAGAEFKGKGNKCNATEEYGCTDSIFSGSAGTCYGAAANGCAGSTFSGGSSMCDGNSNNTCAGSIFNGYGSWCQANGNNACANSTFSGGNSYCFGRTDVCINSTFSGELSNCYGFQSNGCAGSTFSGNKSYCTGGAANSCVNTEIQAGSYCNATVANGCDGALYGAHPDKDSSLIGSCTGNYCPTGVPLRGSWNNATQSYDVSGWQGNCCNPTYMVSGVCPSGIAICS